MALVIFGLSQCGLSGVIINNDEQAVTFPAFIINPLDPLFKFSDGVFDREVFHKHPLAPAVMDRYRLWESKTGPGNRQCLVCHREITDPDNYILIDYLVHDECALLHRYNYTHLHRTCVSDWTDRSAVLDDLKELKESDSWEGNYLTQLMRDLSISTDAK